MRRQAVINFLTSIDSHIGKEGNRENLRMDKNHYKWDDETYKAIYKGITLFFGSKKLFNQYLAEI